MSDDSNADKKPERKPDSEDSTERESVDEKLEKIEKKIDEQQKKTVSVSRYKSEGTTLVLSIVVGFFGFMGVGHIYLGRVRRGIIILIVGLIGWIVAIVIPFAMLRMLGVLEEEESIDPTAVVGVLGGFFVVVEIGVLALIIWQILNSRKLCKQYNEYFEEHGKPPW